MARGSHGQHWWDRLAAKGVRYWTTALIVFLLATTGSSYVYDYLHLTERRAQFFQALLEWGPRPLEPSYISIVLISDQDYWLGQPAGRAAGISDDETAGCFLWWSAQRRQQARSRPSARDSVGADPVVAAGGGDRS